MKSFIYEIVDKYLMHDFSKDIAKIFSDRLNDSFTDQILTDYFVFDLVHSYNLFDNYKIQIGINNIFDEKYQQAHEYSTMRRTFNFGLRKVY